MKRVRSFEARVNSYVNKTAPNGCWLWTRSCNPKGYGICSEGLVHRASYRLFTGAIPEGKYVLHKCDVRNCCNPDHLYIGTQKDNMRDMYERGRETRKGQPGGERHSLAKLSESQALDIIARAKEGYANKHLASQFGIGKTQVARIISGLRWKHLPR